MAGGFLCPGAHRFSFGAVWMISVHYPNENHISRKKTQLFYRIYSPKKAGTDETYSQGYSSCTLRRLSLYPSGVDLAGVQPLDHGDPGRDLLCTNRSFERDLRPSDASALARGDRIRLYHHSPGVSHRMYCEPLTGVGYLGLYRPSLQSAGPGLPAFRPAVGSGGHGSGTVG